MTCIIGLEEEGRIYIGGDSASVKGWEVRKLAYPKVFVNGPFIIGYTTSFRMGQLLQYKLKLDEPKNRNAGDDGYKFIATKFIDAVRKCLREGGFTKVENNTEEGGSFLVGYRKNIYEIASDFQVNRLSDGLYAIGSGASYALGAMKAQGNLDPSHRITKSLEISAYFTGSVLPPFTVLDGGGFNND